MEAINFQTDPSRYQHIELEITGPIATIALNIKEDKPLKPGYALKLNSYDLGVDIELFDAVSRLRFEHPEVSVVVITSKREGLFSAGANIFMLGSSTHNFKVNFCKYTNETRLAIEDATENSGQTYIAALNGIASGGGYELPLACKEIYLVDDRRSAVSLPEVPYLGVLPGTGGLTRLVDKRKIRRDRADIFVTLAEGIKGQRAVDWNLVDGIFPSSKFNEEVMARAEKLAGEGHTERKGIKLEALNPTVTDKGISYKYVKLTFGPETRVAHLEIQAPEEILPIPDDPTLLGSEWYPIKMYRELEDALLQLRFNYPEIGLTTLHTRGELNKVIQLDEQLFAHRGHWFINEVILLMKRVLKRFDVSAKSLFAIVDQGSCFAGSLLELALASDRAYMLTGTEVAITEFNKGILPMGNGLSRLTTKLLGEPNIVEQVLAQSEPFEAQQAEEMGLVTLAIDELDWDDEVRVAIEERASLSPDALTGLEASLRFAGPETLETKIFGRLSAWQNWIFQRPNAVGERGALIMYGKPGSPEFDWRRT
ncbi:MAG: benzoyl-CoA-dihydrodiol lyase [Blastocatellia bacterium]|nr:benzoyl-CoA-dihydrodiol lyase [Blastocatellia bacterium]MBL8196865.1 benzoyl-CoA-dihydrodiol lyase [Blastocatellia bacterium]MBN8722572.1 benzoyl-CoA-dihydrodiol lyase [Acidobacteriota bacterium]